MLKSIQVINFQSHRNSTLQFSPGVNVIVGDPQNGKTVILRALNLLRTNRPLGFRYHSHFASTPATMVKVTVQEGAEVSLSKQDTGASYSVLKNGMAQSFPKVGTGVPDLVTEILNLQDLNVQAQLDSHFLVGDSPADVAREINRVTKIDLIDKWTHELNRRKHALSSLLLQAKRKSEELAGKVQSLDGIEDADPIIKEAERVQRSADQKKVEWNSVRLLAIELEGIEGAIANTERTLPALSFVEKAEKYLIEVRSSQGAVSALEQFADIEGKLELLSKSVSMVEDALQKATDKISTMEMAHSGLRSIEAFIVLNERSQESVTELSGIKDSYLSLISKTGKCPFCFTELDNKSIKHVLEHL